MCVKTEKGVGGGGKRSCLSRKFTVSSLESDRVIFFS